MTQVPRILIADDQRDVLEALRLLLKGEGCQADTVGSPAAALKALEQREYDVGRRGARFAGPDSRGR